MGKDPAVLETAEKRDRKITVFKITLFTVLDA